MRDYESDLIFEDPGSAYEMEWAEEARPGSGRTIRSSGKACFLAWNDLWYFRDALDKLHKARKRGGYSRQYLLLRLCRLHLTYYMLRHRINNKIYLRAGCSPLTVRKIKNRIRAAQFSKKYLRDWGYYLKNHPKLIGC